MASSASATTPSISPTDLSYFLVCPHTYTRKLAGRWELQADAAPLDAAVMEYGLTHESRIAASLNYPEVPDPGRDYAAGHAATVSLLRQGVPGVYQAVFNLPPYRGKPDLLRRVPGASDLGDWHYQPGDIKSSSRTRGEQIVQVVFYALLLERVQGMRPKEGFIILRDGREERFTIADYDLAVEDALAELRSIAEGTTPRPELHLFPGCGRCRWRRGCAADAIGTGDVSLVPGIPRAYRATLQSGALSTADALAEADPEQAAARTGLPVEWLRNAVLRAQARQLGRPVRSGDLPFVGRSAEAIAVGWHADLFTPSRPVVAAAVAVRQAHGPAAPPSVHVAVSPDDARATALRFVREVTALTERYPEAPVLLAPGSVLAHLAGTLSSADATAAVVAIPWADRLVNVRAAARRVWAFPSIAEDVPTMVAQLRGAATRGAGEFLPFAAAADDHAVLLYRRFHEHADGGARRHLSDVLSADVASLFTLFDHLRGAGA